MRSLRLLPVLAVLALGVFAPNASALCDPGVCPPVVTTGPAVKVGNTDATLTGTVTVDPAGGDATCHFEWATNPELDPFDSTDAVVVPADSDPDTPVTATITGLDRNNIYFYRLRCTNPSGDDVTGDTRAFAAGEVDPNVQQQPNPNPNPNPTPPDNGTTPGNGTTSPGTGQGTGTGTGTGTSSSSNSQQQLPPVPKVEDQVPPELVISAATQRNGYVEWTILCPATEKTCTGKVTLRTQGVFAAIAKKHRGRDKRRVLGSASYRLKGGETKKVRVKINKYGRALLRKHQDVKARATFETKDAAGNKTTTAQIITLHADAFRHN